MQVSVIPLSSLECSYKRMDAEYYQPIYLELDKELQQYKTKIISSIGKVTDGEHGNVELLNDGIKYLTAENIKKGFVDANSVRYVSKDVDERNKRARVQVGDILISIKGTLGEIAVAEESLLPANMNRDVAIIKPYSNEFNSKYIAVFLMSRMGNLQAIREGSGGVQQMITLGRLGNIKIPVLSSDFQLLIESVFDKFNSVRNKSLKKYSQSEKTLLAELGLIHWQPKHQLTFIKNYSDIQQAGRIDAEYYQPQYDEIINAIKNYSGGWDTLGSLVSLKDKNFTPQSDKEYKYIELSNISGNGEITGCTIGLGSDLPSRARRKTSAGDIIVSSIEGSLSSIALVGGEYNQALCSTGFYVIDSECFNSETLLVLMKSIAGQMLLKKGCNGTILTAINKDEFLNIILPKLNDKIQIEIQSKVTESFNLRKQSKHLLESAKKAVEMAIEQDEKTAINWLKDEMKTVGVADANGL